MRKQTFACFTKVKLSLQMSRGITSFFLNKKLFRERNALWLAKKKKKDLQVDVSKSFL